ncbi:type II and III secretion system protein family protein [Kiloniella sp. b19]|uniref:type II and III secretion system protein family protein n=1 Tax=Kiloniella sp. GXU_MW_B19 TaxID=3141326 RepID=UPI0031DDF35C
MTMTPSHSAETDKSTVGVDALPPLQLEINAGRFIELGKPAESIFIANPEIADIQLESSRRLHLYGKTYGATTLSVLGKGGELIYTRNIFIEHNTQQLNETVKLIYPNTDVQFSSLNGNLVVSGEAKDAEMANSLLALAGRVTGDPATIENHLRIAAPNQVNLRVQIAEVSRDITKELGLNFQAASSFGDLGVTLFSGSADAINNNIITGTSALFADTTFGDTALRTVIDAIDDKGLITLLAEPNLTAISGESANFLVGGEFPIPLATDDGLEISFKQFGISLDFVPVVLDEKTIHIKVATESSQISDVGALQLNGFQIPAITVRRANTAVNLGSGQSFAIAGLLQNNTTQNLNEYPGLQEIPILGALFRSNKFQRQETELVIIVTPYLVRPVSTQLALPTDGYSPASDLERSLDGRLHKARLADGTTGPVDGTGRMGPVGPVGFILR